MARVKNQIKKCLFMDMEDDIFELTRNHVINLLRDRIITSFFFCANPDSCNFDMDAIGCIVYTCKDFFSPKVAF